MTESASTRPRGVLLVVAFGLAQAVALGLVGTAMIVLASRPDELVRAGASRREALVAGALVSAIALVALVASIGLYRGLARVRTLYAVIATFQIGSAVYALVALRDVQIPGLVVLGVAVGILWLLYGTDATREFFE